MEHKRWIEGKSYTRQFASHYCKPYDKELKNAEPPALELYTFNTVDRATQVWERNPSSAEIYTDKVMEQKLNYIHNNPCTDNGNLLPHQLSTTMVPQDFVP